MRKVVYILLTALMLLSACGKQVEKDVFCSLSFTAVMPDGSDIMQMTIDKDLPGNYLRNVNTMQQYEFPVFVNNHGGPVRVRKGIYTIAFDGVARIVGDSGLVEKKVRFVAYNSPDKAVMLLEDSADVELKLIVLE